MTLAKQAYALADRWDAARGIDIPETSFGAADMDSFTSNQKVVFLERLQVLPPLPASHITHLGNLYKVAEASNAEIRFRFYQLALRDPNSVPKHVAEDAARWVVGEDGSGVIKGRGKFCRPVFTSIAQVDRGLAVEYFERHKAEFHPIARKLIEKVSWLWSILCRQSYFSLSPVGFRHPLIWSSSRSRCIGSTNKERVLPITVARFCGLLGVSPDATNIGIAVLLRWYCEPRFLPSCNGRW